MSLWLKKFLCFYVIFLKLGNTSCCKNGHCYNGGLVRGTRSHMDEDSFLNWPNYDEIAPGLYLGNYLAANDVYLLRQIGVTHVLTIDTKTVFHKCDGISYRFIYAVDSYSQDLLQYFDDTHSFINKGLSKGGVYVHCRVGISRSATIVIAYLMKEKNWDYRTARRYVRRRRPEINPNAGFILQLQEYEDILAKSRRR